MDDPVGPSPATEAMLTMRPRPLRFHDGRHGLGQPHRPRQVHRHDLIPHLDGKIVEVGEGDRFVVSGVIDKNIEAAETAAYVADQSLDCRAIGDIAGERRSIDLITGCRASRATSSAWSRLCAYITAMCAPSLRQRVTDALAEPAVAAGYQRNAASEVHVVSPQLVAAGYFVA